MHSLFRFEFDDLICFCLIYETSFTFRYVCTVYTFKFVFDGDVLYGCTMLFEMCYL